MKRMISMVAAVMVVTAPSLFAQMTKVVIDKDGLLKKIEKSDEAIANPKKAEKAATWLNRGKVFYDAEVAVSKNLYDQIDEATATLMFGTPKKEQVKIGTVDYTLLTFPHFKAYADANGRIKAWELTTVVYDGALEKSLEAYNKAYEMDPVKSAEKVQEGIKAIFDEYYKNGSICYVLQKYADAGDAFEKAYQVSLLPGYGEKDTAVVRSLTHDTGVAYLFGGNPQKSLDYFTLAEEEGYDRDGEIYYLMYHACKALAEENPEILKKGKTILEKGMAKYPDNADIIECMTDVYVSLGEDPFEIVPVVQKAIEKDPSNPALWNGLGRLYERLGDLDKSIAAFEKVAELLPENFSAFYSVGILYLRKGDNMAEELNEKTYTGQQEYNADLEKVLEVYGKSIAPLEKAHELNPTEATTIELLKSVTFRLRDKEGIMEKYNKYNELFKQMQQ